MNCYYCGEPLSAFRLRTDGDFCSADHREKYQRLARHGLARIAEADEILKLVRRKDRPLELEGIACFGPDAPRQCPNRPLHASFDPGRASWEFWGMRTAGFVAPDSGGPEFHSLAAGWPGGATPRRHAAPPAFRGVAALAGRVALPAIEPRAGFIARTAADRPVRRRVLRRDFRPSAARWSYAVPPVSAGCGENSLTATPARPLTSAMNAALPKRLAAAPFRLPPSLPEPLPVPPIRPVAAR